jgi:acyl-CoA synthetase (AMP-forming)/AMP-acid ligase II
MRLLPAIIANSATQVYGLTETYGPITKGYHMQTWSTLPGDEKYAKMARQGHGFVASMPARVIKTDVPDDHIEDVEKNGNEIGEIVFYGNICAKGYYKDEEATRKLFAGGVLHTGDLAVMHPDGAIQILDRAKDIIISGMHDPMVFNLRFAHSRQQEERTSLVLL